MLFVQQSCPNNLLRHLWYSACALRKVILLAVLQAYQNDELLYDRRRRVVSRHIKYQCLHSHNSKGRASPLVPKLVAVVHATEEGEI